jgi:8-oxo-dGTP pyrophosphatase MutT (NUDIX family)
MTDSITPINQKFAPVSPIDISQQTVIAKKFSLRHSFRAGAIVWTKDRNTNTDHYLVFKSYSRPARGVQLPGGRVEKLENVAEAVVREVEEETGVKTKIVCPLGLIYLNNPGKNYSRVEIYYIVRPLGYMDVRRHWHHTDTDKYAQNLECWFVPVDKTPINLASGQENALNMFRQWLKDHKKNKAQYGPDYLSNISSTVGSSIGKNMNNPNPLYHQRQYANNLDRSLEQSLNQNKRSTNSWRNNPKKY